MAASEALALSSATIAILVMHLAEEYTSELEKQEAWAALLERVTILEDKIATKTVDVLEFHTTDIFHSAAKFDFAMLELVNFAVTCVIAGGVIFLLHQYHVELQQLKAKSSYQVQEIMELKAQEGSYLSDTKNLRAQLKEAKDEAKNQAKAAAEMKDKAAKAQVEAAEHKVLAEEREKEAEEAKGLAQKAEARGDKAAADAEDRVADQTKLAFDMAEVVKVQVTETLATSQAVKKLVMEVTERIPRVETEAFRRGREAGRTELRLELEGIKKN